MKVNIAIIHYRHGKDICVGDTRDSLLAEVAEYCRDNWEAFPFLKMRLTPVSDQEIIDQYFEVADNEGEYVDYYYGVTVNH